LVPRLGTGSSLYVFYEHDNILPSPIKGEEITNVFL